MNLVLNGVEALPKGQGAVRVRASLVDEAALDWSDAVMRPRREEGDGEPAARGPAEARDRELLELVVEDEGVGMSDATRARVFDPFFTTKFAGRGLGLAATLGIAKAHGAGLRLTSEPGRGSSFALYLRPDRSGAPEPRGRGPVSTTAAGRVLVVEDEDLVRRVVAKMLEADGYTVITASSGLDALGRVEQAVAARGAAPFDLALIDVTMPGIDGLETLARLRERLPDLPAVLMSGHGADDVAARLTLQRARFLQKPFSQSALRDALDAAHASR
jgi:two-component system cell cycle sensor histidine kinase/response regulator CckA